MSLQQPCHPKYETYHLKELEDALSHLDPEKHPQQVEFIKERIKNGGYQYPENKVTGKRPTLISIIVIVGITGGLLSIPLVNSAYAQNIGTEYQIFLALGIMLAFICHIGFWLMKKWAFYLYSGFILMAQIILINMNLWSPFTLIEPSIVIFIVASYLKRMQ